MALTLISSLRWYGNEQMRIAATISSRRINRSVSPLKNLQMVIAGSMASLLNLKGRVNEDGENVERVLHHLGKEDTVALY